jgi:Family of unknown function (DUF6134)
MLVPQKLKLMIASCVIASAFATSAAASTPGRTDFEILMNGKPVGRHVVTVTEAGSLTRARIEIDMAGRIGPIGFTYSHRCDEAWSGDTLVSINCTDRENRKTASLSGQRDGVNLKINGTGFKGNAPAGILPSSWWRASTTRQRQIMDSRDGRIANFSVNRVGAETLQIGGAPVQTTHYRVRGVAAKDLWYDAQGRWVRSTFRLAGQSFDYRKRTPVASAPRD